MNSQNKMWIKPSLFIIGIPVLIFLAGTFQLDQGLEEFKKWIVGQGGLGPLLFIGVYMLATILALPGSALSVVAGAVFGSLTGVLTVIVGAILGASVCFLISRYLARDWVASLLGRNEKFRRLDALTEKSGAVIVAITRLVPLFPYNLLNYGFGLTRVPFRTYVFWSALCMLPGIVLYVVGADAIATIVRVGRVPWGLVGLAALFLGILTLVARTAKNRITK